MKGLTILLTSLLVCGLAGCKAAETPNRAETQTAQIAESEGTQKYEPFSINKADKGYVYRIYNNNVLIEEQYVAVKEPTCHYLSDSLIYVTVQTGTGKSTNWGFFYDYAANKRSETFYWVLNYTETIVALGKKDRVIIRSVFNDSYYLEIIDFEKPIANIADGILSAELSEDMTTVTVTYVVEDSYEIMTQTFSLT